MMERKSVYVRGIAAKAALMLMLILAFFCWRLSSEAAATLGRYGDLVSFRGVEAMDYDAMLDTQSKSETGTPFALWTQHDKQKIASRDRSADVSALLVQGDSRLVLPVQALVADKDFDGCIIDSGTAFTLFGTEEAVGYDIEYDGRIYTVRGVITSPARTILLQRPDDSEIRADLVTISGERDADTFAMRHGLDPVFTVHYSLYAVLAGAFSGLFLLVAVIITIVILLRIKHRFRAYPLRALLLYLLIAAIITASILFLISKIPLEYIPSRWSDFSFWSSGYEAVRLFLADYFAAAKLRPDILMLSVLQESLYGVLSSILLAIAYYAGKKIHKESLNHIDS